MMPQGQLLGQCTYGELLGASESGTCIGAKFVATREQAEAAILDWMAFYNHARWHSALDYRSPMQYEQHRLAAQRKNAA